MIETDHKTRPGREVDFIVTPRGQPLRLIQVCESLADAPARKRLRFLAMTRASSIRLDFGRLDQSPMTSTMVTFIPAVRASFACLRSQVMKSRQCSTAAMATWRMS